MNKMKFVLVIAIILVGAGIFFLTFTVDTDQEFLVGVDTDQNGVWDYVDTYINKKFSGSNPSDQNLKLALQQFSLAIQGGLINSDDEEISQQYAIATDRAQECIAYLSEDYLAITSELEAVILNNKTRSEAFLVWSEQSAGKVFEGSAYSQRDESCAFNLE